MARSHILSASITSGQGARPPMKRGRTKEITPRPSPRFYHSGRASRSGSLINGCLLSLFSKRSLRGGQTRDRHAERRAANVVEPDLVAEGYRAGLAAVLAADADLKPRLGCAPERRPGLDQLPDAVPVQHLERVVRQDFVLDVLGEEATRIV